MKLSLISFQGGAKRSGRFSEIYERDFSGGGDETYVRDVNAMLALIRYLEDEVDAPDHWICTSHVHLGFFKKDIKNYNEVSNDLRALFVTISEKGPGVYHIGDRVTKDAQIAGEWIRQILNRPSA